MSKLPFELLLALRYLRPKRTFVSIITLISVIGVMLGVAVLIIVISVMSGFDHDLKEKVFGFQSHLMISGPGDAPLKNYAAIETIISSNKNVVGVSPIIVGPELVEHAVGTNGQEMMAAPYLRGVDPQTEGSVSILPRSIVAGTFDLSGRGVVIGSGFAEAQ